MWDISHCSFFPPLFVPWCNILGGEGEGGSLESYHSLLKREEELVWDSPLSWPSSTRPSAPTWSVLKRENRFGKAWLFGFLISEVNLKQQKFDQYEFHDGRNTAKYAQQTKHFSSDFLWPCVRPITEKFIKRYKISLRININLMKYLHINIVIIKNTVDVTVTLHSRHLQERESKHLKHISLFNVQSLICRDSLSFLCCELFALIVGGVVERNRKCGTRERWERRQTKVPRQPSHNHQTPQIWIMTHKEDRTVETS